MQTVYQYLIRTLLPASLQVELQGGSMPRNSNSPFSVLRHGRFVTGPTNLKNAKTTGKIPKIYTFSGSSTAYNLVVYRALSASLCLFIKGISVICTAKTEKCLLHFCVELCRTIFLFQLNKNYHWSFSKILIVISVQN